MSAEAQVLDKIEHEKTWVDHLLGPYRVLRGNRSFDMVFLGGTASALADWLYIVALIVIAYQVTKSPTFVSILTFVRLSPYVVIMPFAGILADRGNGRGMLVWSNLARGVCVIALMAADSPSRIWLAFPLVFAITTLSSIFTPALHATIPAVVSQEDLVDANSALNQVDSLTYIVGPGLGSIFVLIHHESLAFLVTGIAFLAAGMAFRFIPEIPPVKEERPVEGGWLAQNLAGFRFLFRENQGVLAAYMLSICAACVLSGAFWTLLLVLSVKSFHLGEAGTGYLNAANGIGALIGGMITGLLLARMRLEQLFVAMMVLYFAVVIVIGAVPWGLGAVVGLVIFGVADVASQIPAITVIQTATPTELLGRVFAAHESALVIAMLIGALVAGPMIDIVGPRGATIILAIVGLGILGACIPALRKMEKVLGVRIFLREVPVLTALSLQVIDDLASRLHVESFPPGADIVRQGDEGDRLYIVKSGEVDVSYQSDGRARVHLATLSKNDYFGEIALLRNVQRTATCSAKTAVETYSLMRDDFQQLLARSRELELSIAGTGEARLSATRSAVILRR